METSLKEIYKNLDAFKAFRKKDDILNRTEIQRIKEQEEEDSRLKEVVNSFMGKRLSAILPISNVSEREISSAIIINCEVDFYDKYGDHSGKNTNTQLEIYTTITFDNISQVELLNLNIGNYINILGTVTNINVEFHRNSYNPNPTDGSKSYASDIGVELVQYYSRISIGVHLNSYVSSKPIKYTIQYLNSRDLTPDEEAEEQKIRMKNAVRYREQRFFNKLINYSFLLASTIISYQYFKGHIIYSIIAFLISLSVALFCFPDDIEDDDFKNKIFMTSLGTFLGILLYWVSM